MRGKVAGIAALIAIFGITPAYAGKSLTEKQKAVFGKDHPRLCGEKTEDVFDLPPQTGSPPPMRGKAKLRHFHRFKMRITPAYAGKRKICQYLRKLFQDHPRLCGEKSTKSSCPLMQMGSPPPMRGKVHELFSVL